MKREDFNRVCTVVRGGQERYVENLRFLYAGRVVACEGENLVVEAFGHSFRWPQELCREVSGRANPLGPKSNT